MQFGIQVGTGLPCPRFFAGPTAEHWRLPTGRTHTSQPPPLLPMLQARASAEPEGAAPLAHDDPAPF